MLKYVFFITLFVVNQCFAQKSAINPDDVLDKDGNLRQGYFYFDQDFVKLLNISSSKKIDLEQGDRQIDTTYSFLLKNYKYLLNESNYFYNNYDCKIVEYYSTDWYGYDSTLYQYLQKNKIRSHIKIGNSVFYHDSIHFANYDSGLYINAYLEFFGYLSLPYKSYLLGSISCDLPNAGYGQRWYSYAIFDITTSNVICIIAPQTGQNSSISVFDDFNNDGIIDFVSLDFNKISFWTLKGDKFIEDKSKYIKVDKIGTDTYKFDLKKSKWFKKLKLRKLD